MAGSCAGMFGLAAGLEGSVFRKVPLPWRLAAVAGGLLLIYPGLRSGLPGFSFIAAATAFQLLAEGKFRRGKISKQRGTQSTTPPLKGGMLFS